MDRTTQNILDDLRSDDKEIRYHALLNIMEITGTRVEWAYQVWDEMLANLKHKDNHIRSLT
jgi:cytochrome c-type biogenesis protein CcmH/NrfG